MYWFINLFIYVLVLCDCANMMLPCVSMCFLVACCCLTHAIPLSTRDQKEIVICGIAVSTYVSLSYISVILDEPWWTYNLHQPTIKSPSIWNAQSLSKMRVRCRVRPLIRWLNALMFPKIDWEMWRACPIWITPINQHVGLSENGVYWENYDKPMDLQAPGFRQSHVCFRHPTWDLAYKSTVSAHQTVVGTR